MSAEKTLELLKKLKEDPKAKELLDGLKNTSPADDVITCYAQIAAKLGYAITAEETGFLAKIKQRAHLGHILCPLNFFGCFLL